MTSAKINTSAARNPKSTLSVTTRNIMATSTSFESWRKPAAGLPQITKDC